MSERTRHVRLCRAPDGAWEITFPFNAEANDAIRRAGARWNTQRRTWVAAPWRMDGILAALHTLGYEAKGAPSRPAATVPAATAFLRSLPPRLREPVFKALVKVLHPDAGGDTAAMAALNRARDAA